MDSWESLVLQWINCLWEDKGERITNLEQLEDGVIYHKLIGRMKPWNSMEYQGSEKEVVLQFLQDEYPKFSVKHKNQRVRNLLIASVILSRLSLEPIFHKFLCSNLSADMQIKIKLVLEAIYPLGKKVTEEDFFKIFSLQIKPDFESPGLKPRFLLEEFLKSPIMRTVHSDSKIHDQSRQLRKLRAEIETLSYEKSELVEDIKAQEKQIKELQTKLHDTLVELKSLRRADHNLDEADSASKTSNASSLELTYKREVESLESYVAELQNENVQLQDEKSHLTTEIKAFKEKYIAMKEKNKVNENAIESMLLQLEKKEEELADLKLRHEELCNHLKEKSKVFLNNFSCDLDDKSINETSFNKSLNRSEALSSVVEIQLQDTKRELIAMQNNFRCINSILTALIEEYDKLKRKAEAQADQNEKSESKKNLAENDDSSLVEIKPSLANVFKEDSKRILFFDLLNSSIVPGRKLKDCTFEKKYADDLLKQNEKFKMCLQRDGHKSINYVDKFTCTFHNVFWRKHWDGHLFVLLKVVLQEMTKLKLAAGQQDDLDLSSISLTKYNGYTSNEIYLELMDFIKSNCGVEIKRPKPKTYSTTSVQTDVKNYSTTAMQTDIKEYSSTHMQTDIKDYSSTLVQTDIKEYSSAYMQTDIKEYSSTCMQTDAKEYSAKDTQTEVKSYFTTSAQTDVKNYFTTSMQTDAKEYATINIQTDEKPSSTISIQTDKEEEVSLLSQDELKSVQSSWFQLSESMQSDSEIHKTLKLLDESWNLTVNSFKEITNNYESQMQPELKELLTEKDAIDSEMKELYAQNMKILSSHLVSSVQLVTTLAKDTSFKMTSVSEESDSAISGNLSNPFSDIDSQDSSRLSLLQKDISNKITDVKKKIHNFDSLVKLYEEKLRSPTMNMKMEKEEEDEIPTKLSSDISQSAQFQNYAKEIHEKYESKLEKMKEKMKTAFNSQIVILKKEQEIELKNKIEALQTKFEYQCHNHSEELKKYKKHISDLSTQLWDVGEKLIAEREKNKEFTKRIKDQRSKSDNIENQQQVTAAASVPVSQKVKLESHNVTHLSDISFSGSSGSNSKNIQHVRGFQIMGNAFSNEDEEGEVFDTTYLTDMQKPRESLSTVDLNRLSILQMRNSKVRPHLKSSYPTEVQYLPPTLTEDDIKSGNPEENFLNDSLSQSLLTGEKVKRKVRSKNNSETPRRSRRFSNIFRKPRMSTDHK